jgi:hypothetical protein
MASITKYSQFLSRAVLLAGYVLLFAVQGNYRFYTVANFFDYHSGGRVYYNGGRYDNGGSPAAVTGQQPSPKENATVLQSHLNTHNSAHLGMDKRFSAKLSYKLPDNSYSLVVSAETIEREYALLLKVYSASDLPTNALRGPPIV